MLCWNSVLSSGFFEAVIAYVMTSFSLTTSLAGMLVAWWRIDSGRKCQVLFSEALLMVEHWLKRYLHSLQNLAIIKCAGI